MTPSIQFSDFISLGLLRELEIFSHNNNCILWIRNKEFDCQLYVSSTYKTLMGQECITLYKDPLSWTRAVNTIDQKYLKGSAIFPEFTKVFSINYPKGQISWFQDHSFHLPLASAKGKIIAGCALYLPDIQLLEENKICINEHLDKLITQYYRILTNTCPAINTSLISKEPELFNSLSKRERDVLKLFLQGKTIVETADAIHLSPRTIETYLTNLKEKLHCESKSSLIMKAIENGWILLNL